MTKLLIALSVEDVKIFTLYYKDEFTNCCLCSANIEAIELAIIKGIKNVITVEPTDLNNNILESDMMADQLARALDAELGHVRSQKLELNFLSLGWDYLNFYFQFYCLIRSKYLGELLVNNISGDYEIIFLTNNNPLEYYFDSNEFRISIVKSFAAKFNKIKTLNVNRMGPYKEASYDYSVARVKVNAEMLIHLPTCFYSMHVDKSRAESFVGDSVDLMSPYFDVQIGKNRLILDSPIDEKYHHLASSIIKLDLIHDAYKSIINDFSSISLNLSRLRKRAALQLDLFDFLQKGFVSNLQKIEISDHDAGLQGPILTHAKNNGIQVDVYPHSTINFQPIIISNTTCRHGPNYSNNYFSGLGVGQFKDNSFTENKNINKAERGKRIKKIILVMNQIEDVAGIALYSITDLLSGLRFFENWAKKCELNIYFKQKPSHKYSILDNFSFTYIKELNSNDIKEIDACIAIGSPTSYLDRFSVLNKLCINLSTHRLMRAEKSMIHSSTNVIEAESFELGFIKTIQNLEKYI